jgi:hypothetical protein
MLQNSSDYKFELKGILRTFYSIINTEFCSRLKTKGVTVFYLHEIGSLRYMGKYRKYIYDLGYDIFYF